MSPGRPFAVAFGVALAVTLLRLTACSAIDPNPPDPHDGGTSEALQVNDAALDAIDEETP